MGGSEPSIAERKRRPVNKAVRFARRVWRGCFHPPESREEGPRDPEVTPDEGRSSEAEPDSVDTIARDTMDQDSSLIEEEQEMSSAERTESVRKQGKLSKLRAGLKRFFNRKVKMSKR